MKKKTDGMLALFFSFFFFLWFLILCREPKGDTVRFLQFLEQTPALELLRERLASETTRVILEAILFFFLQRHWLLFALANAAVTALAIRLLGRLSDRLGRACALPASEERAPLLLMTFLFFLYPLEDLAAAGIPPTFINYVWPSAFGLLALWPVADLLAGKRERIPAPWLAASPVLILIAGNMEQMAAILTGALTGAAGYYAAKNYAVRQLAPGNGSAGGAENGADRKARRDSLAALLFLDMLAALSLLFHLQGGNAARMELSIRTYWPGFERLTVLEKLGNGVFSTMNHLLSIPNLIVLSAAFLLFLLAVTGRGKSRLLRAAGTLPFLWELLVLALKAGEVLTGKQLLFWLNGVDDPYTDAALCPAGAGTALFWQALVLLAAFVFILAMAETGTGKLLLAGILALGFASRVMLGFSPTLFASHTRTFYYLYLALLLVQGALAARLWRQSPRAYWLFFGTAAAAGTVNFIRMALKAAAL